MMQTTQNAPEYLSEPQLLKVLAVAKQRGNREYCMFLLAYGHGLRATEVASLTLDDVRGGMIHCARGKESETTDEQLRDHEQAALRNWLRERGDADGSVFLFTSRQGSRLKRRQVYNLFRKCAELAGVSEHLAHPHILKHSYGTHLHQHGASPFYIMKSLGHKDVRTSLRYTHVSTVDAQVVSDRILGKVLATA
jgi:site-specific recombinase XerD